MQDPSPTKETEQRNNNNQPLKGAPYQFQLSDINQKLRKNGFLSITPEWDSGLPLFLMWINKNWEILQQSMRQNLRGFVQIIMLKIFEATYLHKDPYELRNAFPKENLNIYEKRYPMITEITELFRKKLDIKPIIKQIKIKFNSNDTGVSTDKKDKQPIQIKPPTEEYIRVFVQKMKDNLNITSPQTDRQLLQFLQIQRLNATKKNSANERLIRQTKNLKREITQNKDYISRNSQWSDTFNSIDSYSQSLNETLPKETQILRTLFLNSENQRLPNNTCLACSKFYFNKINIHDQSAFRSPVRAYSSIHRLREVETQLRDGICGMLNADGGVFLFGCEREYRGVIPHGEKMSEKDKEEFQQRIQSYLKFIYPRIQFGREVTISFVPIVDYKIGDSERESYTGLENKLKENRSYIKHPYKDGVFVTRVKVRPADPTTVYFYQLQSRSEETRDHSYKFQSNGVNIRLSSRAMRKLIKQKMKHWYVPEQMDEQSKRLLGCPSSLGHQCEKPDVGLVTNTRGNLDQPSRRQRVIDEEADDMCLVVVQRKNFKKVQEKLNNKGIKCYIKTHFEGYKFKFLNKTGVLHHSCSFRDILREVDHDSLEFEGKQTKVINVEGYLKIERDKSGVKLRQEDFMRYYRLFSQEFTQQELRVYEWYDTGEYYLETQSKLSLIFLYFQLASNREQAKFKNPKDWERMAAGERKNALQLRYSRNGAHENIEKSKKA